jgi:hypothetical protein
MGKVGKNHGQSARASRQKSDAYGKFTRGSGVEVVPEASGGREIPSTAERAPEASAGRKIPFASELALRDITRREMRSGSSVVDKKTMAGATASSSLSEQCEYDISPPLYLSNPRLTIISGYVWVPD